MRKKSLSAILALLPAVYLMVVPGGSASASPDVTNQATEQTQSQVVDACVQAKALAAASGADLSGEDCRVTTTARTSEGRMATAAEVSSDRALSSAQRSSLLTAMSSGPVYSKNFSWFTTGGAYTVTHNGTFYYNGWKAWVGESFAGYQGNHACFVNYSAGLTINPEVCSESGTDFSRDLLYKWQVAWPWFSYSVQHLGHVYSNGVTS
ncbi:hypothetical protein [Sinomonas sp. P47F7]|uniref:hypothetical protein n=1 Tax=Sinomonas sp. P47F7 TaxID=3410987 RepID=UPI003BF5C484